METGVIWLGGERNIKGKRQELSGVWNLRIHEDGISPLRSEDLVEVKGLSSGWLLSFLIFRLNPNICLCVLLFMLHQIPWELDLRQL